MGVVSFALKTPLDEETIRGHIAAAKARNLRPAIEPGETLAIIAGGPSASLAPQDGTTLALNAGLSICTRPPTFYAACDPQEIVADFLTNPPSETTYYIASKCHPKVFDALEGRDVRLWDIADYVPGGVSCAPSITLTALLLFFRLGWRRFEVYGWDGCFRGEQHHVGNQPHAGDTITLEVGERSFTTTTTWAQEAEDALYLLAIMEFMGAEITIHGDAMVQAIREYRMAA